MGVLVGANGIVEGDVQKRRRNVSSVASRTNAEEMFRKGYTIERVCEVMGKPYKWAVSVCTGIEMKPVRRIRAIRNKSLLRKIINRWKRGDSVRTIGKEFNMCYLSVWKIITQLKKDEIIK